MEKKKYFLALYILISVIFSTCKDSLGVNETETITAVNLLSTRDLSYYSFSLYWTICSSYDFDRYEVHYKKNYMDDFTLYYIVRDIKTNYLFLNGLLTNHLYYFFIRVVNKNGDYADSEVIWVRTLSNTSSPVTISYTDLGGEYRIDWDNNLAGIAFTRYELYMSCDSAFVPSQNYLLDRITYIMHNYTYINKNNLVKNTTYYFIVRIYNVLEGYTESDLLELWNP
jgi:hypothetical protein